MSRVRSWCCCARRRATATRWCPFRSRTTTPPSRTRWPMRIAQAAAVLLVNDAGEGAKGDKLAKFSDLSLGVGAGAIPVLHVRRAALDGVLLSSLGEGLRELESGINRDLDAASRPRLEAGPAAWRRHVSRSRSRSECRGRDRCSGRWRRKPSSSAPTTTTSGLRRPQQRARRNSQLNERFTTVPTTTARVRPSDGTGATLRRDGQSPRPPDWSSWPSPVKSVGYLGSKYYCERQPCFAGKHAAMV